MNEKSQNSDDHCLTTNEERADKIWNIGETLQVLQAEELWAQMFILTWEIKLQFLVPPIESNIILYPFSDITAWLNTQLPAFVTISWAVSLFVLELYI